MSKIGDLKMFLKKINNNWCISRTAVHSGCVKMSIWSFLQALPRPCSPYVPKTCILAHFSKNTTKYCLHVNTHSYMCENFVSTVLLHFSPNFVLTKRQNLIRLYETNHEFSLTSLIRHAAIHFVLFQSLSSPMATVDCRPTCWFVPVFSQTVSVLLSQRKQPQCVPAELSFPLALPAART